MVRSSPHGAQHALAAKASSDEALFFPISLSLYPKCGQRPYIAATASADAHSYNVFAPGCTIQLKTSPGFLNR
jgi:hypothetical protein